MTSALERLKQLAKEKQNVQSSVPSDSSSPSNPSTVPEPSNGSSINEGVAGTIAGAEGNIADTQGAESGQISSSNVVTVSDSVSSNIPASVSSQSNNGNGGVNDAVSANTGPVLVPESDNPDSGNHSSVESANSISGESNAGQQGASDGSNSEVSGSSDSGSVDNGGSNSGLASDHPIKMKLAELEQALIQKIPEFRTILRDIHAKLRQDPDIVTAMSPEEVSVVVQGLMTHAQVDVLAGKAVKAAKKAAKTPINASDL